MYFCQFQIPEQVFLRGERSMPTYEYECEKCRKRFEAFQKMSEPPLARCPDCAGEVKRLIGTGAGIIYRGGGFYTTEYRSSDYQKRAKEEKENKA